jgi:hypothetical protein
MKQDILINEFVLVQFATNKPKVLFVRQVEEKGGKTFSVKYIRRHGNTWKCAFPEKDDVS